MTKIHSKTNAGLSWLDEITPQRAITLVIILIIIAVALYFAVRAIKKGLAKLKIQDEINDHILKTGEVPSFTNAEYVNMSDILAKAFDGFGTDEAAVYSVFQKMKNKTDVLNLIDIYGYRPEGRKFFGVDENLINSLKNELSASELKKVNDILASKGINYAF